MFVSQEKTPRKNIEHITDWRTMNTRSESKCGVTRVSRRSIMFVVLWCSVERMSKFGKRAVARTFRVTSRLDGNFLH